MLNTGARSHLVHHVHPEQFVNPDQLQSSQDDILVDHILANAQGDDEDDQYYDYDDEFISDGEDYQFLQTSQIQIKNPVDQYTNENFDDYDYDDYYDYDYDPDVVGMSPHELHHNREQMAYKRGMGRCHYLHNSKTPKITSIDPENISHPVHDHHSHVPKSLPNSQIIYSNGLQIVIEKRKDLSKQNDANLLSTDNVIIISGRKTCLVFDADFDSYLIDHALPTKTSTDAFGQYPKNGYLDKTGFIEEDVRNVLRVTLNMEIAKMKNREISREQKRYGIHEDYFEITGDTLKQGFLNYRPMVHIDIANQILDWSKIHNFMQAKLQDLSTTLSQAIMQQQPIIQTTNHIVYDQFGNPVAHQQVDNLYQPQFNPIYPNPSVAVSPFQASYQSQYTVHDPNYITPFRQNVNQINHVIDQSNPLIHHEEVHQTVVDPPLHVMDVDPNNRVYSPQALMEHHVIHGEVPQMQFDDHLIHYDNQQIHYDDPYNINEPLVLDPLHPAIQQPVHPVMTDYLSYPQVAGIQEVVPLHDGYMNELDQYHAHIMNQNEHPFIGDALQQNLNEGVKQEQLDYHSHPHKKSLLIESQLKNMKQMEDTFENKLQSLNHQLRQINKLKNSIQAGQLVQPETHIVIHEPINHQYVPNNEKYDWTKKEDDVQDDLDLDEGPNDNLIYNQVLANLQKDKILGAKKLRFQKKIPLQQRFQQQKLQVENEYNDVNPIEENQFQKIIDLIEKEENEKGKLMIEKENKIQKIQNNIQLDVLKNENDSFQKPQNEHLIDEIQDNNLNLKQLQDNLTLDLKSQLRNSFKQFKNLEQNVENLDQGEISIDHLGQIERTNNIDQKLQILNSALNIHAQKN